MPIPSIAHLVTIRTTPLSVTFKNAADLTGLSESHLRFLARVKRLETVKLGRKRLVRYRSLEALLK
jgi:excisionase family DNA binding protein